MDNLKEKVTSVKTWVKDHKKVLLIGTGCVVAAGVGAYFCGKALDTADNLDMSKQDILDGPTTKFVPELAKFGVEGVEEYSGAWEFMTGYTGADGSGYPTKVGDIPEIVESFKAATGVTDENDVYILMNVGK